MPRIISNGRVGGLSLVSKERMGWLLSVISEGRMGGLLNFVSKWRVDGLISVISDGREQLLSVICVLT